MTEERQGFDVYPALDVLEGRCVRLDQGRRKHVTVEVGDPAAAATRFVEAGARWLHLVDLDGAFAGRPSAGLLERMIAAAAGVPVQVGGGFRTPEAVAAAIDAGAARVVIGTAAVEPETLSHLATRFGSSLVVAIDVRDGRVATDGWTRVAAVTAAELARRCAAVGVARLLVTSTRRDGSLHGPDLALLDEVLEATTLPVIAAGGIASLTDLHTLRELGCEGVVVGSALWRRRFTLTEALTA